MLPIQQTCQSVHCRSQQEVYSLAVPQPFDTEVIWASSPLITRLCSSNPTPMCDVNMYTVDILTFTFPNFPLVCCGSQPQTPHSALIPCNFLTLHGSLGACRCALFRSYLRSYPGLSSSSLPLPVHKALCMPLDVPGTRNLPFHHSQEHLSSI